MSSEIDLGIKHHFAGGTYAKEMTLPMGYMAISHKHQYDHLSILSRGRAMVEADGIKTEYIAPACITIAAGVEHSITAMSNTTWFCIHATDETDPEKVDSVILGKG